MARIFSHGLVDSTNERAFEALLGGTARDGDVHVARGQAAGRGRLGRRWESPPDEGLYCSLVHLPPVGRGPGGPPAAPAVTMAAGLAVLDALGALGLAGARLKWPNDVVTDRGKLAGILVESRSPGPGAPHFVVGIGINVRQDAFGAELLAERAVTSLALEGVDVSPTRALEELVGPLRARLEAARGAPERIAADYLTATGLAGASVVVRTSGEELVGVVTALGLRAGLELSTDAGFRSIELAHVHAVEAARL